MKNKDMYAQVHIFVSEESILFREVYDMSMDARTSKWTLKFCQ